MRPTRLRGNFIELESFFGQTAQLMAVSAAGRGLAMHVIGIEEQQVVAGLDREAWLRQRKQDNDDQGGQFHGDSGTIAETDEKNGR